MNEHWSDEVIDELIREADLDGNGEIDYEGMLYRPSKLRLYMIFYCHKCKSLQTYFS